MKLLFYIRQEVGQSTFIERDPRYVFNDDIDEEVAAFFEPSQAFIEAQLVAKHLDSMIVDVAKTLSYVVTDRTIELTDNGLSGYAIYTYFKLIKRVDKTSVQCAFSTFERLETKSPLLRQLFAAIADEMHVLNSILDFEESTTLGAGIAFR
ncbi:MAG: hypothetical protein K0U37_07665 [Gammaproteobacteria bacterium]|nr:hypothetical protein [Gammaproteobacteria bacterium]